MKESNKEVSTEYFIEMNRSRWGFSPGLHLILRLVLTLLPIATLETLWVYEISFLIRFYFLTNFVATLWLISHLFGSYIALCDWLGRKPSFGILRFQHIMYEVTLMGSLMVTIVYWSILHQGNMKLKAKRGIYIQWLAILHHIIPIFWGIVDIMISKYIFKYGDWIYMAYGGFGWTLNNLIQTKLFDRSPYVFLTWEDRNSIYAVLFLFIFIMIFYFAIWALLSLTVRKDVQKQKVN